MPSASSRHPSQEPEPVLQARDPSPAGSRAFFEFLVNRHYRQLYLFALSLSRNEHDASDLVQEAFRRWGLKGHQLRDPDKAKSWLYKTLYRSFLDSRRKSSRWAPLEEQHEENPPGTEQPHPERSADQAQLLAALQQLPEQFRLPLTLFYLDDCSYKEIATILGVRIGTIMSRLARAKDNLHEQLSVSAS